MILWVLALVMLIIAMSSVRAPRPRNGERVRLIWSNRRWFSWLSKLASWLAYATALLAVFSGHIDETIPVLDGYLLAATAAAGGLWFSSWSTRVPLRLTDRGCYGSFRFVPWSDVSSLNLEGSILVFKDESQNTVLKVGGPSFERRQDVLEQVRAVQRAVAEERE